MPDRSRPPHQFWTNREATPTSRATFPGSRRRPARLRSSGRRRTSAEVRYARCSLGCKRSRHGPHRACRMSGCASACRPSVSPRMSGSRRFNEGSSGLRVPCAGRWRRCDRTPSAAGRGCGCDTLLGPMRLHSNLLGPSPTPLSLAATWRRRSAWPTSARVIVSILPSDNQRVRFLIHVAALPDTSGVTGQRWFGG